VDTAWAIVVEDPMPDEAGEVCAGGEAWSLLAQVACTLAMTLDVLLVVTSGRARRTAPPPARTGCPRPGALAVAPP